MTEGTLLHYGVVVPPGPLTFCGGRRLLSCCCKAQIGTPHLSHLYNSWLNQLEADKRVIELHLPLVAAHGFTTYNNRYSILFLFTVECFAGTVLKNIYRIAVLGLVQAYLLFLQLIDAVSERNHLKKISILC